MDLDNYAREEAEKLIDKYIQTAVLVLDNPVTAYLKRSYAVNLAKLVIKLAYTKGQTVQLTEDVNMIKSLKV
jgi:hypothetical protein